MTYVISDPIELHPTRNYLQIIRQEVDVPRIQKSSYYVRRLQISNCLCVLFDSARKIPFAVQMIAVLFEYFGQPLRIVLIALSDAHRNVVQILFEQQRQFALQILFVQMEHFVARCYDVTCAKLHQNGCRCIDGSGENDELVGNVNDR